MGSPPFALPALQQLVQSNHQVISVYTREPKPCGRGKKITKTPIHIYAEENDIQVLTPKTLKTESIQRDVDLIVVVAYGMLLPQKILEAPKIGCINIHPSLLPRWRGAAPIQHALMAGDTKTGVCIMNMTQELDAGDILSVKEVPIQDSDDYTSLHHKLSEIGATMLIDVVNNLTNIKPQKQSEHGITYATKIKKEIVEWTESADHIIQKIKALQGIHCIVKGKKLKILKASCDNLTHTYAPGTIVNKYLHIACTNGIIKPQVLQMPGKSAVIIEDFLRGNSWCNI